MPKRSLKKRRSRRRSRRVRNSRRYMKKGGGVDFSDQKCNTARVNQYIDHERRTTDSSTFTATANQYCRVKTGGEYDSCDKNGTMNTTTEDRTPYCYKMILG